MKDFMNKALFLDRDGVINVDHGYVSSPDQFEFTKGIFEACLHFQRLGYLLIVITNQSGIARGYSTEEQFNMLTAWMCHQFSDRGVRIHGVYFCPHHPDKGIAPYVQQCQCRKPGPGLILKAISDHGIDPELSIMVGDKPSDMQAAANAGVRCKILVGRGSLAETNLSGSPDALYPDMHSVYRGLLAGEFDLPSNRT